MTNLCQKMQQFKVCSIWKPFETMDCLQQAASRCLYEYLSFLTFLGFGPLRHFDTEFEDLEILTWHSFISHLF